jgi:hypothetical protein
MKTLLILFALTSFKFSYCQDSIFGVYNIGTSLSGEKTHGTVLQLNCDHSYLRSDSIAKDWGKWELKDNNILILYIDTMSANGRTEKFEAKVQYKLIEQKLVLHDKEYSKKAFKDFIRYVNKNTTNPMYKMRYSDESYEKYRLSTMNLYFERKETISCK